MKKILCQKSNKKINEYTITNNIFGNSEKVIYQVINSTSLILIFNL